MKTLLSAYDLLRFVAPVSNIPQKDLLLMANSMRQVFKPLFDDLMSSADRGVERVLGEVALFHVPGRDILPLTVAFNGMPKPPNFRCMMVACLSTDPRFPQENIAVGLLGGGGVVEGQGQDQWLLVSLDGEWFALSRTFTLKAPKADQRKVVGPEIKEVFYLVDPLSEECLAGSLLRSPGAILQMAKAFSFRSGLQADSLKSRLSSLEERARFGEIFHDLLQQAYK